MSLQHSCLNDSGSYHLHLASMHCHIDVSFHHGRTQVIAPYLTILRVAKWRELTSNSTSGVIESTCFRCQGSTDGDKSLLDEDPTKGMVRHPASSVLGTRMLLKRFRCDGGKGTFAIGQVARLGFSPPSLALIILRSLFPLKTTSGVCLDSGPAIIFVRRDRLFSLFFVFMYCSRASKVLAFHKIR